MADPIDHDGLSTAATVGSKAVKWGLLGAIAAFAIPALAVTGVGLLLGSFFGIGAIGAGIGAVVGTIVGASTAATYGGGAAVAGGLVGAIRGSDQVSRENAAHRNRGRDHQLRQAKTYNDHEIRGIQEGYHIAQADMQPIMQQREMAAYQKGRIDLANQIQEQMNAQMAAQAGASQTTKANFADKELSLKCESKAEAVLKQRELEAMTQKQV
ncbi:MAG: hypothetical protein K2Q01_11565 [Rickettsiales bacterium]|nr:hypothetical protein [Rickettsiales bacterium]